MGRNKVVHDPKEIVAEVASAVLSSPVVAWADYQENKDAGVWFRTDRAGVNFFYVNKEILRGVIRKYGQLNMNRAIVEAGLVERGSRDTPCLQVKTKNSQTRIVVYAFYAEKLRSILQ